MNFVYLHVHNAIREELVGLEAGVKELLSEADGAALAHKLAALKERYTFLERIYKYHSSVEDEVCAEAAHCLGMLCTPSTLFSWLPQLHRMAAAS